MYAGHGVLIWAFQTAALSDIPNTKPSTIKEKYPLPGAASPVKQYHLVQGRKNGQEKQQKRPALHHPPTPSEKDLFNTTQEEGERKIHADMPFLSPTNIAANKILKCTYQGDMLKLHSGWGGRWGPDQEHPRITKCWRVLVLQADTNE